MVLGPRRVRVEKDVILRVIRNLKGSGQLNVAKGQEITPSEIIGSGQVSGGFRTLNLSALLSVAPQDVKKYLKRELGQRIYQDELLAFKPRGLFHGQQVVTAPTDGILDFLNTKSGEVRMSLLPKKEDLPAGVYGVIENIDHKLGQVLIRTQVTRIHGVAGTGRPRWGSLHILGQRDGLVGVSMISPKFSEHIIVGGSLIYKDAISAAISAGINGIITGGINAKDYKSMAGGRLIFPKKLENDVGISVVVCEGFGSIPIGMDIYEILVKYEGKFVLLDGNLGMMILPSFASDSLRKVKTASLPPMDQLNQIKPQDQEIKAGCKIRVVGATYPGEQGIVLEVDKSKSLLPSGIWANLLTIETRSRKIRIPAENIELL